MAHFHPLTVAEVRRETPDSVSIAFTVPEELSESFRFKQGQYLTLRTTLNGEEVRRSYSVCVSPHDNELRVAVKKVEGGLFSTYANDELKAGDVIESMLPMGRFFTEMDEANEKHYVGFAAGSGITPVMSILKTVLQAEPKSSFTLIYGNRSFSSIIFREELEALKNKYLDRFTLHHVLSREDLGSDLFYGRIDGPRSEKLCDALLKNTSIDDYFLCGPEDMIMAVTSTLEARGVDKKKVHFELFTTAGAAKPKTGERPAVAKKDEAKVASTIRVVLDGEQFEFPLKSDGENILDAALAHGADLPYACKGGVCCTCRAKLLEGDVHMEVNYALEEEEVEQGFILTCQSHPRSERVVIDFDE